MDFQQVKKLLKRIKVIKPKILVIGDIMLDCYVSGSVSRISPEAPVPILSFDKEKNVLGGAGNVVHNLVNLGAEVSLATIIGSDLEGETIRNLINKLKISSENIYSTPKIQTTKKTRFISNATHLLRLDNDSKGYTKRDFILFENKVIKSITKLDCIIVSDYDKGVCTDSLIRKIIIKASNNKIPVFVDPKGKNWNKYSNATCLTPNKKEAESELGLNLVNDLDYEKASQLIIDKYKLKSCLITRGSEGMTYNISNNIFHQKVSKKEVFDVSGAGDLVIACIGLAYASKLVVEEYIELSSELSSEVVEYVGTVPFSMDMLKKRYA